MLTIKIAIVRLTGIRRRRAIRLERVKAEGVTISKLPSIPKGDRPIDEFLAVRSRPRFGCALTKEGVYSIGTHKSRADSCLLKPTQHVKNRSGIGAGKFVVRHVVDEPFDEI